jgi:VIT1/CCC1 family predicted Fe2+/Mn2+ transporter
MKIVGNSKFERLSNLSFLFSIICFGVFYLAVWSGQRGGDYFYSNLYLAIPITIAALAGMASAIFTSIHICHKKSISLVGIVSILFGALIFTFILGEIISPH